MAAVDPGAGRRRARPRSACCSSATATRRAARSPRRCSPGSAGRTSTPSRPARARARSTRSRSACSPRSASTGGRLARSRSPSCSTAASTTSSRCRTARARSARPCSGPHSSLHWHLEDPSTIEGSEERRLEAFRATRTELTVRLRPFIEIARRAAGRLPAVAGPEPTRHAEPARDTPLRRKESDPWSFPTPSL